MSNINISRLDSIQDLNEQEVSSVIGGGYYYKKPSYEVTQVNDQTAVNQGVNVKGGTALQALGDIAIANKSFDLDLDIKKGYKKYGY